MGGFSTFGSDLITVKNRPGNVYSRFFAAGQWWVLDMVPYVTVDHENAVTTPQGFDPPEPKVIAWTENTYLDASIKGLIKPNGGASRGGFMLRMQYDSYNYYLAHIDAPATARDFAMFKCVSGSYTLIAAEAVDLVVPRVYFVVFSISGSSLKSSRNGGVTFQVSATDTSITSEGFAGLRAFGDWVTFLVKSIGPPMSPLPRPLAYFEVPIIGSGSAEDPFRAQLPEQVVDGVNILALSHSSLIKSGSDGKPKEYTAIVRVFDQPDRDPSLAPISKALEALKAVQGVRQLTREEALRRAKQLDDKLTDLDLLPARELRKDPRAAAKEYKQWRVGSLGVKEELIDDAIMERYANEDKGW